MARRRGRINVETDSEDDMLLPYFVRTRRAKRTRPRQDNYMNWESDEFFARFRVTKETAMLILKKIEDQLEYITDRNYSLTPMNQLLLTLRFYATAGSLSGDAGYPAGKYLLPPLRNPTLPEEHLYNESHIRTRNTVERLFGVWKARFPILAMGIKLDLNLVQPLIVACAVVHNIALQQREMPPPIVLGMDEALLRAAIEEGQMVPDLNLQVPQQEAVRNAFVQYFRGRLDIPRH